MVSSGLWGPHISGHHSCDACAVGNCSPKWGHSCPQTYGLFSGQWDTGWVCRYLSGTSWTDRDREAGQVLVIQVFIQHLLCWAAFAPKSYKTCLQPLGSLTPLSTWRGRKYDPSFPKSPLTLGMEPQVCREPTEDTLFFLTSFPPHHCPPILPGTVLPLGLWHIG